MSEKRLLSRSSRNIKTKKYHPVSVVEDETMSTSNKSIIVQTGTMNVLYVIKPPGRSKSDSQLKAMETVS